MNENAGLDDPDGGDFYPVVEKKKYFNETWRIWQNSDRTTLAKDGEEKQK